MQNSPHHTYEEIREAVVDIILKRVTGSQQPYQFAMLHTSVAELFARRESKPGEPIQYGQLRLSPSDSELIRDVFWDLFRQGFITLGMNDSNPQWPFFRISYFGEKTLDTQSPYRFHDTSSFLTLVRNAVPDILPEAVAYLDESVAAFYAGCSLASCVMLGVAAEAEFLRLADVAAVNSNYGQHFSRVAKRNLVRQKITAFHDCLKPLVPQLPYEATEDLETNINAIQSVLRIARNDAGHPTGASPQREQVYVYLQLFIPFARQLMRLRKALS